MGTYCLVREEVPIAFGEGEAKEPVVTLIDFPLVLTDFSAFPSAGSTGGGGV